MGATRSNVVWLFSLPTIGFFDTMFKPLKEAFIYNYHIDMSVEELFNVGAQYGFSKARRHPSTDKYIFGVKNNVEIFDLEKTQDKLEKATQFAAEVKQSGKKILFVTGKREVTNALRHAAQSVNQPYVAGRWIGGTLTNFGEITKRVDRLKKLRYEGESGQLTQKYTKKERLLITREIERLEERFGGVSDMEQLPGAIFVIDPRDEATAVREARRMGIAVIALASNDCDYSVVDHVIPANDSNITSIKYFIQQITNALK